jgi:cold shock CspA family protein
MAKTKTTVAKTTVAKTTESEETQAAAQTPVTAPTPEVVIEKESQETPETETDLITSGRVKWFNNKAGYGFITINDCETNEERDMFVHHTEIKVDQSQYKYLVQGEYVEFVIGAISRENKVDVHATNVRGINGGKLMCETRNETRSYRTAPSATPKQTQAPVKQIQAPATQQIKQESRRPQLDKADQSEWMVVPRRRTETVSSKQRPQPRQRQPTIEIAQ